MSYYDHDGGWSGAARQPSWEHPQSQSQSHSQQSGQASLSRGASASSGASTHPIDPHAFVAQFEEIERATDNLMKTGKWFPGAAAAHGHGAGAMGGSRRDSMPTMGGAGGSGSSNVSGYEYSGDARLGGGANHAPGPARHQSVSDFEAGRPGSAGLQGFYQGQRFPAGRQSEAEQLLQQKRRLAAQRERELRNYHQEQQYHRRGKSDRSMSPNTMSEEDRRDLIARQHRALYGETSSLYGSEGASVTGSGGVSRIGGDSRRGPSPLAYEPYGVQSPTGTDGVQVPPRDRERGESTASPVSGTAQQSQAPHPAARNSGSSSPGTSPPLGQGLSKGVAPIGTRPVQPSAANAKRSTTPLTPSSLSHGVSIDANPHLKDERATSAASNPSGMTAEKTVPGLAGGGWGANTAAVWGSGKSTLAVQPSVWG